MPNRSSAPAGFVQGVKQADSSGLPGRAKLNIGRCDVVFHISSKRRILGILLAAAVGLAVPLAASGAVISGGGGTGPSSIVESAVLQPSVLTSSSTIPQSNGWFRASVDATVSADTSVTVVKNGTTTLTAEVATSYPFVVSDPGTTTITHWSFADGRGNAATETIRIDTVAPVTTAASSTALSGLEGWSRSASVTMSLVPTDALSGVAETNYQIGAGPVLPYTIPFAVTGEGISSVKYQSKDLAGNEETSKTALVKIDTVVPLVSSNATNSASTPATVTISATDASSGVERIEYRLDAGTTQTVSGVGPVLVPVAAIGSHTLHYVAYDHAGNASAAQMDTFSTRDGDKPVSTISTLPAGWTNANVTFSLSTTTTGGVGYVTYYGLNAAAVDTYTVPVTVSSEGTTTINYRAVDASGHIETTNTAMVRIDKTAPRASALLAYASLTDISIHLTWSPATDDVSGVACYEIRDGASVIATTTGLSFMKAGLIPGSSHTFSVVAVDRAGNSSSPTTLSVIMGSAIGTQHVSAGASRVATIPLMSGGVTHTVVVTFPMVSSAGTLTVTKVAAPPAAAPAGLKFVGIYYDVSFTGSFTGTATVTFPYPAEIPDARALNMTVAHWVNGSYWVNEPTVVDTLNHTMTVQLTTLGPLAVVEPITADLLAKITPRFIRFYPPYDAMSSVTAWLRDASGAPLDGHTLLLQRLEGVTWSTYTTMTPEGEGRYRGWVKPINYGKTSVRIVLADNLYGYSAPERILTLIPEVWLSSPKPSVTSIRHNHRFSVTGSMLPAHAGTGSFYVTKWNGRHYDTIAKYTKSIKFSSSGKFKTYLSLPRGTYRFYSGEGRDHYTADHGKSRSGRSSKVTVR